MPKDILDFMEHDSSKTEYIIEQLIRPDSGYGIIAARTGLGKTNMILNLSFWLALGKTFFSLNLRKSKVCYFAFEGGEDNLRDRYMRLILREGVPVSGWLQVERLSSLILLEKNSSDRFRQMIRPFDVILLDPIKWMVGADYTKPGRAAEFTKVLTNILHQEGKIAIFSMQIRKRDPRVKIEPGDLFELEGAADYVEDAAFTLLLERSELRGKHVATQYKDRYLTLYFAKHREATRDLDPIELYYDYDKCEFKVV